MAPYASPDDIDPSSIWSALKSGIKRILIASLAIGVVTYSLLSLIAPRYTSEAQLSISAKGASSPFADPKQPGAVADTTTVRMDKEAINTHVRALQSTDLVQKIADDLKLSNKPEFNSALGQVDLFNTILSLVGIAGPRPGESERDRVKSAFYRQLEVYSPKESRLIAVRFNSIDPELAAAIANGMAEKYRAQLASQAIVETDDVQKALQPEIDKLEKEVAAADAEVERFRGEVNLFKGGKDNTSLNDQQLAELNGELTKAKAARSEAEARAKSAREMMKSGSAEALSEVQKSPLIQSLVQSRVRLERQIAENGVANLPGHPVSKKLNADLAGLKRQINAEVGKFVDSLEKEAKIAALREDSVKKSLDVIKATVVNTGPDLAKLAQIETSAKAKRGELERLRGQFEANRAKASSRAVPVEAQIIAKAERSSVPTFPKKVPMSGFATIASFLLGTAWVITRALFTGARTGGVSGQAARPLPARAAPNARTEPQLHAVPPAHKAEPVSVRSSLDDSSRHISAQSIARHILAHAPGDTGYRTIIAGETGTVDPSSEALALAKAIADIGKQVILIDWDINGEGVTSGLLQANAPGVCDLLAGAVTFEDVVKGVPGSKAHIIPAGTAGIINAETFDPDQLNLILDALDEAYEHIIVTGEHHAARALFEAIQGRFDAAIVVADPARRASALADPPDTFLGFEVTDIDVLRLDRASPAATGMAQRFIRNGLGSEARPG